MMLSFCYIFQFHLFLLLLQIFKIQIREGESLALSLANATTTHRPHLVSPRLFLLCAFARALIFHLINRFISSDSRIPNSFLKIEPKITCLRDRISNSRTDIKTPKLRHCYQPNQTCNHIAAQPEMALEKAASNFQTFQRSRPNPRAADAL